MSYQFSDRFKTCDEHNNACNWTVLRNSDLSHQHRLWESGKYILTAPGNRHLANTPALDEVVVEATFAVNDKLAKCAELNIFFWYNDLNRTGFFVNCRLADGWCAVALGREHGNAARMSDQQSETFDASGRPSPWKLTLRVERNRITVCFEDCPPFEFPVPDDAMRGGRIGFDRGSFLGPLELHEVKITSTDDLPAKILIPQSEFVFPPDLNGFHTPLRYRVAMAQFGDAARIDLELSGSDTENPDLPWFPYHGLIIDTLTAPYLRIGNRRLYPATKESLVLARPNPVRQNYFYESLHAKPKWPLRASFFLSKVPELSTIGIGYEHCEIEGGAEHLAGGPNEVIVDLPTKAPIYAGPAVRDGQFVLELHSQADKEVCRRIPNSDPRYDAALAFARRNHFFIEPESCRFRAILRCGSQDVSPEDVKLVCRLENAFTEEIRSLSLNWVGAEKRVGLDFIEFAAELPSLSLSPGVYHLHFDLAFGGRTVITQRHAFEVMSADPEAPAAPVISGLPVLFSMPNEVKGLVHDQFEPYLDVENTISHYLSIATHCADVGRRHRIYDGLKVYHRKWFLWLTDRTTENPDMELYRDVVAQCDFIQPPVTGVCGLAMDLWKHQTYRADVLDALIEFMRGEDCRQDQGGHLTIAKLETIKRDKAPFPEAAVEELVVDHWSGWLPFFEKWLSGHDIALQGLLKELNPDLRRSGYGPMNVYVAHGKTSHVLKYRGTIQQSYDGFLAFEDYPLSCKYNIHRGPFMLATLQMASPETRIYPEIYRSSKQGCPDGAVNYAYPPFGATEHSALAEKKRFLEYVYGAVWFHRGLFHYWKDHGFHARSWSRDYFEVLLETWKFISHAKPARPLRGTAYAYSDAVCERHPAFYEYANPKGLPWGDIFNTAEEAIPWAWESARIDGQQSGFVCSLESLHELGAQDTGLLVLPPLCSVTDQELDAIRSLHEQGVNLLAFENVNGLEDLFGVAAMGQPVAVRNIRVDTASPDNPLAKLRELVEYTEHPLCEAKYGTNGAKVLLEGEAPVLLLNETATGKAALFNIPPTVVRRDSFYERVAYGRNSISELMNQSVATMQRELGAPVAETTAGKLLAFESDDGHRHIIVEEDAFPEEGLPIDPLVTVRWPGIGGSTITCDKPCDVKIVDSDTVKIRLHLGVHECGIITIGAA